MELHFEVELAVIMGTEVRDLDERDEKAAMDAVDCRPKFLLPFSSSVIFWSPPGDEFISVRSLPLSRGLGLRPSVSYEEKKGL